MKQRTITALLVLCVFCICSFGRTVSPDIGVIERAAALNGAYAVPSSMSARSVGSAVGDVATHRSSLTGTGRHKSDTCRDSIRIIALLTASEKSRTRNLRRAAAEAQEACKLAEHCGSPRLRAAAYASQGWAVFHSTIGDSARTLLRRAERLARVVKDSSTLVSVYNGLAYIALRDDNLTDSAGILLAQAQAIAERRRDTAALAEVLNIKGYLHAKRLRFGDLMRSCKKSLEYYKRVGDSTGILSALIRIASARILIGGGPVDSICALVIDRASVRGDSLVLAEAFATLGVSQSRNGYELKNARTNIERALIIALACRDVNSVFGALSNGHVVSNLIKRESRDRSWMARTAGFRRALNLDMIESMGIEHYIEMQATQLSQIKTRTLIAQLLAAGLALMLITLFTLYRLMKGRRREALLQADSAVLRAEAATLQAQAAEAEVHRLAAEKEHRENELRREMTRGLFEMQEVERKRIASDLHDSLGQELVVIKNRAMLASEQYYDPDVLRPQLDRIIEMTGMAMSTVREITHNLRPTELDRLGLTAALRSLVHASDDTNGIRIEMEITAIDHLFSQDQEILIYRIVQEAISNILRHSHATEANVRAGRDDGELTISVSDDGRGFSMSSITERAAGVRHGLGLRSMQERVEMLGGRFNLRTAEGQGTSLRITIPVVHEVITEISGATT